MDGGVKISSILVTALLKIDLMNKEYCNNAALEAVIKDAYSVFHQCKAPAFPLDVCLACCMSPELEQEMRQLPLAKLGRRHFYEYNTSVKGEVQPVHELRYLLPRMLELMVEGVDIHHSIELSLDRVGRCPVGSFRDAELEVLNRFAMEYFRNTLCGGQLVSGYREDPPSVLLMFHIGGLAVDPLLELWLQMDCPESTVQLVHALYWDFSEKQDYKNAFATDHPAFRETLREWILNPQHRQRFVEKLLQPEFQRLTETRGPTGYTAFSTMVDAVFDQLSQ